MTHIYTGEDTKWGLLKGTPVFIVKRRMNMQGMEVQRISDGAIFVIGDKQVRANKNNPKRTHNAAGKKRQKKGGRKK